MRKYLINLLVLCAATTFAGETPKDLQVVLLVGQSNMAGRAKIQPEDEKVLPGVFLFNAKQEWEPAVPPYNRYAKQKKPMYAGVNPGVGFATSWNSEKPLGIVCQARGGTSIGEWLAENSKLYASAISEAQAAMKTGILAGILWHQGESDSKKVDAYPAQLKELVSRFRRDLGNEKLPFVFGQVGQWNPSYEAFNEMIIKQPAEIPFSACVTTEGLVGQDSAHFDTPSQRELGKRYAAAFRSIQ